MTSPLIEALTSALGDEQIIVAPKEIESALRDNSWLSPLLAQHIRELKTTTGKTLQVDAVVIPNSIEQLKRVIALAVRHNVPMLVRGGGTSNFGQTIPLHGGIIIDIRRLTGIIDIGNDRITVAAGTIQGDVDAAARARGLELPILTTTYASATAAGWVAGGHVGLGANTYGTIWDGNILGVKLLTAEDPPREITLTGDDVLPVLHTYGTTGVIIEVTFRLVPAHRWVEAVGVFDDFSSAVRFTAALADQDDIHQRVVAAQDAAISRGFTPLRDLFAEGQSLVLMIVDAERVGRCRELTVQHGGRFVPWKTPEDADRISIGLMVYGHRMLWIKKLTPQSAFLHVYFSPDRYAEQLQALANAFGSGLWLEFKYIRSRWLRALRGLQGDGNLPAAVLTLVPGDGDTLHVLMDFCKQIGVSYQNPHTFLLEESGLFPDFAPILSFKRRVDPKNLLNPGKIGQGVRA